MSGSVKTRLKAAGLTGVNIVGAMGPSVKADVLGDKFSVVDPSRLSEAARIQGEMEAIFKPHEKLDAWLVKPEGQRATISEQAAKAAETSRLFYIQFVAALDEAGLLLGSAKQIHGEHTGGVSSTIQILMYAHSEFVKKAQKTQISSSEVECVIPSVKSLTAFFETQN